MYVIDSVRQKDGTIHERELRRKGHRVFIAHVAIGDPLEVIYVDDSDKVLRTSPLEAYNADWNSAEKLIAQTKNSVYVFSKAKVNE